MNRSSGLILKCKDHQSCLILKFMLDILLLKSTNHQEILVVKLIPNTIDGWYL